MAAVLGNLKVLLGIDSAAIAGDMGKVRATVAAGISDMQSRSQGAMRVLSTEIAGVSGAVKGAQQATGIAMKSLELMGEKGSAAVAGIGNALSGLLAGGFTPLGIAMAAVTAGIALFTGEQQKAQSAVAGVNAELDRQKRLFEDRAKAQLEARAVGADRTPEEQRRFEEEQLARARLSVNTRRLFEQDAEVTRIASLEAEARARGDLHNQHAYALQDAQKRLDSLMHEHEVLVGQIRDLEQLTEATKELDRAREIARQKGQNAGRARAFLRDQVMPEADEPFSSFWVPADEEQREEDRRVKEYQEKNERAARAFLASCDRWQKELDEKKIESPFALTDDEIRDEERRIEERRKLAAGVAAADRKATGFADGFTGAMERVRGVEDLGLAIGEDAAHGLASSFEVAFDTIIEGSGSASERLREFAANFARDLAMMSARALAFRMILSAIPGFGDAGVGSGPGAYVSGGQRVGWTQTGSNTWVPATRAAGAHGGTWRVGGLGGLDSVMVAMRASPGELVKVSGGANSKGETGDVHVALTVRPPAVIADEVMARSSPAARAAVVATAMARPGRRGARARD